MRAVISLEVQRPLTLVRNCGSAPLAPGRISLTSTVPVLVPSVFHSSEPCVPLLALKYNVPLTFVRDRGLDKLAPD